MRSRIEVFPTLPPQPSQVHLGAVIAYGVSVILGLVFWWAAIAFVSGT